MGRGPARPQNLEMMGRGQALPIIFLDVPPRPGHHIFEISRPAPARPSFFKILSPAHFQNTRPGPAHHNFQIGPARPDPDHWPMTNLDFTCF